MYSKHWWARVALFSIRNLSILQDPSPRKRGSTNRNSIPSRLEICRSKFTNNFSTKCWARKRSTRRRLPNRRVQARKTSILKTSMGTNFISELLTPAMDGSTFFTTTKNTWRAKRKSESTTKKYDLCSSEAFFKIQAETIWAYWIMSIRNSPIALTKYTISAELCRIHRWTRWRFLKS